MYVICAYKLTNYILMKTKLWIALMLCSLLSNASQPRKVLILGIDGTRSDALQKANTPNIDAILARSFFTYECWHRGITISGPSWSTILCGVEYKKHGVTDNNYANSNFNTYPYFTTRAKSCLPNLQCVQIVQWAAMSDYVYNDSWDKKIIVADGKGERSVTEAKTQLTDPNLDVLFVYFGEVDIAGHTNGFSPSNPSYINAIETVDGHVGKILTALYNRPDFEKEEWIVLLTTDHGGIFTGHGGDTPWERQIWWAGAGNRKGPAQLSNVKDPGSIHIRIYDPVTGAKSPAQYDIAVTALDHLLKNSGCGISSEWNLDGKSWLDSIYTDPVTSTNDISLSTSDVVLYPNPSTSLVTVWYANPLMEKISYQLMDGNGRKVEEKLGIIGQSINKLNIDFNGKQKGIYFLTFYVGLQKQTKKIVID